MHELFNTPTLMVALVCGLLGMTLRMFTSYGRRELRMLWFFLIGGLLLLLGSELAAQIDPHTAAILRYAAIGCVGFAVCQVVVVVVFQILMPTVGLRMPRIAQDLSLIALLVAAGGYGIGQLGVNPGQLFTTSAILTAVLAFSMQDTLGNIMGGVVVQLDNSLKVGDIVRVDDISGRVVDVRWRYTAIETGDRETVVIPNSWLMKNRFRVLRPHAEEPLMVRRTLQFLVDPRANPALVIETINQAVADSRIALVSESKKASTIVTEVTAGYNRFALRYWLLDPDADSSTDSQVRIHVLAGLQRASIRMGSPQEVQRFAADDELQHKEREQAQKLAAVRSNPLFNRLSVTEQATLASQLVTTPFAKGGVLTRQGARAHWLYLIVAGEVEVVKNQDGRSTRVAMLSHGEYFGEMGLLTGEPRTASVFALTDVQCFRLDKQGLAEVIESHPAVAQEIAAAIEQRRADTSMQMKTTAETELVSRGEELLDKIRSFFNLGQ